MSVYRIRPDREAMEAALMALSPKIVAVKLSGGMFIVDTLKPLDADEEAAIMVAISNPRYTLVKEPSLDPLEDPEFKQDPATGAVEAVKDVMP